MIDGIPICLENMLEARERRVTRQNNLINHYQQNIICLTLNIPGPIKNFPLAQKAFDEGCFRIKEKLSQLHKDILDLEIYSENTGYEAFFVVKEAAQVLKISMTELEETDELGRLFDIDVIQLDGYKVSRKDVGLNERTCLLCNSLAPVCGRSRKHTIDDLLERIVSIISEFLESRGL